MLVVAIDIANVHIGLWSSSHSSVACFLVCKITNQLLLATLPEIGGHGSMFPYTHIRILTAANVLRALRASRERSACSQQTSEKLSSNWKHALETRG